MIENIWQHNENMLHRVQGWNLHECLGLEHVIADVNDPGEFRVRIENNAVAHPLYVKIGPFRWKIVEKGPLESLAVGPPKNT